MLVLCIAKDDASFLQVMHAMCRINRASTEWLEGVRKPVPEDHDATFFENPDSAEAPDGAEAPSEEQEKTAALTSA